MKKSLIIFCLLLLSSCSSTDKMTNSQQLAYLKNFRDELKTINAFYIAPWEFVQTKHYEEKKNDVHYLYAIKHKKEKLEIRYAVTPFKKKN